MISRNLAYKISVGKRERSNLKSSLEKMIKERSSVFRCFSVPITKKISTDFSFFSRISFTSVVIFRKLRRIQAAAPSVREASHARLSRVNRFPCFLYVTSTRPPNILCVFFLSFTRVVIEQRRAWGQLFSLGVVTFRCLHGVYKRCKFGDFPLSIGCGMFSILSLRIT